ncbi:putative M-phase phosphoprotein [Helianthus debilis subsp. tardiflorus]
MAKRELSSTLKNLKFMQRGANKEEKTIKEEEVIPDGSFPANLTTKKCMVVMEGDPSPGAIRGRMSFQSFNPSIDKLNEEASNPRQSEGDSMCSGHQGGKPSNRENEEPVSEHSNEANGDIKRKQVEVITEVPLPNNSPNIIERKHTSSSNNRRKNSSKRGKLDFNVLRSPNRQNKMG